MCYFTKLWASQYSCCHGRYSVLDDCLKMVHLIWKLDWLCVNLLLPGCRRPRYTQKDGGGCVSGPKHLATLAFFSISEDLLKTSSKRSVFFSGSILSVKPLFFPTWASINQPKCYWTSVLSMTRWSTLKLEGQLFFMKEHLSLVERRKRVGWSFFPLIFIFYLVFKEVYSFQKGKMYS